MQGKLELAVGSDRLTLSRRTQRADAPLGAFSCTYAGTESSLANMDYIWYASPNKEALEQYPAYYEETYGEELDQENFEIMAAPADVLDRCTLYENLPAETLMLYNDLWTELDLCIDVIYHDKMKAYGLRNLIEAYHQWEESRCAS